MIGDMLVLLLDVDELLELELDEYDELELVSLLDDDDE